MNREESKEKEIMKVTIVNRMDHSFGKKIKEKIIKKAKSKDHYLE